MTRDQIRKKVYDQDRHGVWLVVWTTPRSKLWDMTRGIYSRIGAAVWEEVWEQLRRPPIQMRALMQNQAQDLLKGG